MLAMIAVADPIRTTWPARQPSPKNSPYPSTATTPCRPIFETTDSFTLPF